LKILLLDIETAPSLAWVWTAWQEGVIKIHKEWEVLMVSAMWLGDQLPRTVGRDTMTEKKMLEKVAGWLDEADVVVAHNGDDFDIRRLNARFLKHGIPPPSPYRTIDTKKVAKYHFYFDFNSLAHLGEYLGHGSKVDTGGFSLWLGCMKDDKASWKKMREYNQQDVLLLKLVYLSLRPWMKSHPNVVTSGKGCAKCGSTRLQSRGVRHTQTATYQRYQCMDCAGWSSARKSDLAKPMLTSI
jgi:hypothetical protein